MKVPAKLGRAAGLIGALFMFSGMNEGKADPYRWCAVYGGRDGGGTNCGFITLEQCRVTISGMGGFCEPNQFYDGKPYDQVLPVRRKARH
jgi:Protein of unknown function (DUF3551)